MIADLKRVQIIRVFAFSAVLMGQVMLTTAAERSPDSDGDGQPDAQDSLPALATLPLHWSVAQFELQWRGMEVVGSSAWHQTNALSIFSLGERKEHAGSRQGANLTASPFDIPEEIGLLQLGTFGSDEVPWGRQPRLRVQRFALNPDGRGRGLRLRFQIYFRNFSAAEWYLHELRVPIHVGRQRVAEAQLADATKAERGILFPGGNQQRIYSVYFVADIAAEDVPAVLRALGGPHAPRFVFEEAQGKLDSSSLAAAVPLSRWFENINRQTVAVKVRGGDGRVLVWRVARKLDGKKLRVGDWAEMVNQLSHNIYGRPFWVEKQGLVTSLAGWNTGAWECWWHLDGQKRLAKWSDQGLKREVVFELRESPPRLTRSLRKDLNAVGPDPIVLHFLGSLAALKDDQASAAALYKQSADFGYAPGLCAWASALEQGNGVESNARLAARAGQAAATQDYAPGAAWLGRANLRAIGVARNPDLAYRWLSHAAAQSHPDGLALQALCLTRGVGVKANPAKGLALTRRAALLGSATAQFALGIQLLARDNPEALDWLSCAAQGGDAKAQTRLARCLMDGNHIARDPKAAIRWYRRAAEQGEPAAQLALGRAFRSGRGVKRNPGQAVNWLKKAAVQGNQEAQTWLGFMLLNGEGIERDNKKGLAWIRKAAEQNHPQAQYLLGLYIYAGFDSEAGGVSAALKWFRAAARQDVLTADVFIGFCYYEGRGVKQNRSQAFRHFLKAAEKGSATGQIWAAYCYAFGEGTDVDVTVAREWAQKAWNQGHPGGQLMLHKIAAQGYN